MTEGEVKTLEDSIKRIDAVVRALAPDKINREAQINELRGIRNALTRLLPPDRRIHYLMLGS